MAPKFFMRHKVFSITNVISKILANQNQLFLVHAVPNFSSDKVLIPYICSICPIEEIDINYFTRTIVRKIQHLWRGSHPPFGYNNNSGGYYALVPLRVQQ